MFYSYLRHMRKLKGYTIREVAERSGVSPGYISQLENGNRNVPSPDIIAKLSEGLNVPYVDLMNSAGYLEVREAPITSNAPVNLRRFLRENELMFDGILLTEQDKEWIERTLTALFWKERENRR